MRLIFLVSVFLVFSIQQAYAYNCVYMGVDSSKNLSGLVFEGTVLAVDPEQKHEHFEMPEHKVQFVTFQVDKIWNDRNSYMITDENQVEIMEPVQGGGGCPIGFGFETGKSYLVFARQNGAILQANAFSCVCANSSELGSNQAKQDLKAINTINKRLKK